eukprot:31514-Pelagococcus_subviridis.AAC.11
MLRHERAVRDVLIPQHALLADGAQEKVMRQKLQRVRRDVVFEAVNLDPSLVVDVRVLPLRRREVLPVVKKLDVLHHLFHVLLRDEAVAPPTHHREVPSSSAQHEVSPVGCEVHRVRPQRRELQVERLPLRVDVHRGRDVRLLEPERALVALGDDRSGGVREEPLLEERRARRRVVRELLGVAHVRLGLAVRDLGRLRHGLALGELLRARVELLLEALLSSRHVLDHVVGGGMRRSRDGRVERLGRARGGVEASFLLRRLVGAVVQGGGDHRAGGRARHPAERARRRRRETRERARRRLPWSFAERR